MRSHVSFADEQTAMSLRMDDCHCVKLLGLYA